MKRVFKILSLLLVVIALFSLLFTITGASAVKKPINLTISVATSLKDVMQDIAKAYKKEKPEVKLTFNFGASGTLQKQIEQGAPVDVFISAGAKQMNALKSQNLLIDTTNKNLLLNEVVLIAKKDSELAIKGFKDLTNNTVKIVALGEPKSVPCGQYAEEILTALNILDQVKAKAVYGKDVRELLTWVEQGNADVGVVYKTDALISTKVKIIETAPSSTHSPVVYPEAVIGTSKNASASKAFLKYLSDKTAKVLFEKYGFKMATK